MSVPSSTSVNNPILAFHAALVHRAEIMCRENSFVRLVSQIHSETLPEAFDVQFIQEVGRFSDNPYRLSSLTVAGQCALNQAAATGNILLIRHIVKLDGKEVLDLMDGSGCTPLYTAISKCQCLAVKTLIELGADINQPIMLRVMTEPGIVVDALPMPITNLFMAILTNNQPIIKLIVKHGGILDPGLDQRGQNTLITTRLALQSEKLKIFKAVRKIMSKKWKGIQDRFVKNPRKETSKVCTIIADYV